MNFDVAIIGSGFGGSVAALRLVEKGYRVLVIEAGARFADHEFARNSFDLKRFLFFPKLGLTGIQRIDFLKNVLVLSGAGVGGGSLVYANTLYRPPQSFYKTGSWANLADWQTLLEPYYDLAERMLGVEVNPYDSPADKVMRSAAAKMGVADSYRPTPLGIFFGQGKVAAGTEVADPYFGGVGPSRRACINCGECMTGCRHGAKNTLVKNYLGLAEKAGAEVWPLTKVDSIEKLAAGGFELKLSTVGKNRDVRPKSITVPQVIVAAGALGSAKLLQRSKDLGLLPNLSERIGELSRTNSESLLGVVAQNNDRDFSLGAAITSSFYPSGDTHIESVRYGRGSGFMGLLQTVLASTPSGKSPNPLRLVWNTLRSIAKLPSFYNLRTWPERTLILLVMQARDNSLTTYLKRGWFGSKKLTSKQGTGEANPSWVPAGHDAARLIAAEIGGTAGAVVGEPFGIPLTAHFIGGCVMADSSERGVVDPYLRAFGVEGLHVWDGSALSANPGVNPSLSITAIAEWAAAHWPNRDEKDLRPAMNEPFVLTPKVTPQFPVVPKNAYAALKITPKKPN